MGYLFWAVVFGALLALVTKRGRKPTPEEDENARTIGRALHNMPLMESLGAVGPPEARESPFATDVEPEGDNVIRVGE